MIWIGCVSVPPHAFAHAHYFARCLNLTVKILTLGSNAAVVLTDSLVYWDSLQDSVVR